MENKSAIDMTIGTEWKQILRFSLPIMLGHALQQLYNAVDSIVVGNFAGATKAISERYIAAIGGGVALMFLFLAMAVGLGMGGGIQISQFYGARRYKLLRRTASTQIITMGAVGIVLSAIAFIFARPLLSTVMNYQDPLMLDDAVRYYKVAGLGVVFVYIYNAVASNLNAIGDSKATLYFLAI
ncbi:MAG: MATE family efflux transporter, partial [Clostridiales bacterium]|nr:MATE family efflux transporter [Clostridiales bacterium]